MRKPRQGECVAATAKRQFSDSLGSERIHYQLSRRFQEMGHVFHHGHGLAWLTDFKRNPHVGRLAG